MAANTEAGRPFGWYHGWNIVAVCVLAQLAANGLAINSMSLFLGSWSHDLHAPISQLLIAMLPMAALTAVASPIVGALADKYPTRWLFGLGLAGIAIFNIAMSTVVATWQIWALYGLLYPAALVLASSIPANAVVSRWFTKRLGLALGVTAFGVGISGVVLPPLIAAGMPLLGWRGIWRLAGIIVAVGVLPLTLLVLRDRPTARDGLQSPAQQQPGHSAAGAAAAAPDLRWGDILKRRNFWLLVACYLPIIAVNGGAQQNLAPIVASHGYPVTMAGTLLAVFSLAHVVSTLAFGLASDRFGNRLPLAGLAAAVALGGGLIAFAGSLPVLVCGVILAGVGGGVSTLLPAAAAVEFGPAGVGRAFGAIMLFIPINACVPSIIAKVQETSGSYAPSFSALALLCLAGGGLVLVLMRERRGGHATAAGLAAALEQPSSL